MQSDLGKLFIGGISWDTNEERLKEYFSVYGEVLEAVIMKDRSTGRARGFGFVVFADPVVAERVIKEKHNIDGRMVEAKKAVPRDDQNTLSRSSSSIQGSPGPGRTRKIFVGGLASTVTEADFKKYFEQFGTITDVVVMYDHNTQRPRGFGFITYDSEDAVDKVLLKTFHELNGKMVEVKRAVPKELSPGPSRTPLGGYNYGVSRINNFLNDYAQGYSPSTVGGYGLRMDGRSFSPITGGRSGYAPFGSGYGMGLNFEPGLNPNFGGNANLNNTLSYGRGLNPYYIGNTNRFGNPVGYDGGGNGGNSSFFSSRTGNLWGNGGRNYGTNSTSPSAYVGSGSGSIGATFTNSGVNWGLLQFHLKVGVMYLVMAGILVMEVVITAMVWEGEGMEEILQLVGPPHHLTLHQMVVMMGLLQTFMVVVQCMGTPLGVRQTLREKEVVHLVMDLAMERPMFPQKVLPVMLVVIVLLRDRQIEELLARRIPDISMF